MCRVTGGWSKGREENLLGVTRQRNHFRLWDSPERKAVGGQDSLCGKYRCAFQLNQKGLSYLLTGFSPLQSAVVLEMCFYFLKW